MKRWFFLLNLIACALVTPIAFAFPTNDCQSLIVSRQYVQALECFEQALQEEPKNWQIWQNIGNCQMHLGKNKEAIESLQKSIELGGLHATQCTIMAAALEGLGQPTKARSWLKLACKLDQNQLENPVMQAAIKRLEDPAINVKSSPNASDYASGLTSTTPWRKRDMPLKVYVRSNYQLPTYHKQFLSLVCGAMDQWCQALDNRVSYQVIDSPGKANLIWDYTEHRELCTSDHEPGLDGATQLQIRASDNAPIQGKIVILVKDSPAQTEFRTDKKISAHCLHEMGHALGMHGHSSNNTDVMFLASNLNPVTKLSQRDKNTIRKLYAR